MIIFQKSKISYASEKRCVLQSGDFCVYVNTADAFLYTNSTYPLCPLCTPNFFRPASASAQVSQTQFVGPRKLLIPPRRLSSTQVRHHLIYIADVPCPLRNISMSLETVFVLLIGFQGVEGVFYVDIILALAAANVQQIAIPKCVLQRHKTSICETPHTDTRYSQHLFVHWEIYKWVERQRYHESVCGDAEVGNILFL